MKVREIERAGFLAKADMLYYSIKPISKAKLEIHVYNRNIETPQSLRLEAIYRNYDNFREMTVVNEILTQYNKDTQSKVTLL